MFVISNETEILKDKKAQRIQRKVFPVCCPTLAKRK